MMQGPIILILGWWITHSDQMVYVVCGSVTVQRSSEVNTGQIVQKLVTKVSLELIQKARNLVALGSCFLRSSEQLIQYTACTYCTSLALLCYTAHRRSTSCIIAYAI